ncbi:MAG: peptide chain release factor N(5)-glutamine methyltransferase [Eubacterium sp.]|nr:peptide chain release factor N(5)-glutamine methyltransferase [Eubacterium sp.]
MRRDEARHMISDRLRRAGIDSYEAETWLFMDWVLSVSRAEYYADPQADIPEDRILSLEEKLSLREGRYPLQYMMETCDFMGFPFYVNENVLIPRQDTECLVEETLRLLAEKKKLSACRSGKIRVLDLCTGSGCIGISISLLCPWTEVVLADLSPEALQVASRNAGELGAEIITLQGDLFDALSTLPPEKRHFDLIVSNPPYIPTGEISGLMPEVRDHEPCMALDGSPDGLAFYRRIIREAPEHLREGGILIFEIGSGQARDVEDLLAAGGFADIHTGKDLAGLDRMICGRLS